jgi:hypothetical protein
MHPSVKTGQLVARAYVRFAPESGPWPRWRLTAAWKTATPPRMNLYQTHLIEVVAGRVSVNNGQKVKELARAPQRNENAVLPGQKSIAWDRVDHVVCPTDFWFSL